MSCTGQPFVLLAEYTSCAESPPCTHIQCYTDIACLLCKSFHHLLKQLEIEKNEILISLSRDSSVAKRNLYSEQPVACRFRMEGGRHIKNEKTTPADDPICNLSCPFV